jgi:ketosteroid isomerase-like protein
MVKDWIKLVTEYHDALNRFDFDAIAQMFADDAEYHSPGIGGLYGRHDIMAAMHSYFAEFCDQVSSDENLERVGDRSVRTEWKLQATTKTSGRIVKRQGVETITFNDKGLIAMVEVQDVEPVLD